MPKISKREIIILVITALAILYFGYEYFIAGPARKKVKTGGETVKIENTVSGLAGEIRKDKLSETDIYVIKKTKETWGKDPFLRRDLYRLWMAKEGSAGGEGAKIIYSGYVDSGRNRIAILNGLEYRIGEELKEEGYVLKHVSPFKVMIFDKRTGSNLEIPLQE